MPPDVARGRPTESETAPTATQDAPDDATVMVAPSALLELSDERDTWLRRIDAAWREGFAAGSARQYSRGYAAAVADVKRAQHALYDHLRKLPADTERWSVRGEPRTRETYANPHPEDYQGRGRDAA